MAAIESVFNHVKMSLNIATEAFFKAENEGDAAPLEELVYYSLFNYQAKSLENVNACQNCIGSVKIPTTARHNEENSKKLVNILWFMKKISFVEDQDFYNIFDTITLANEDASNELLAQIYYQVYKSNKPFMKFFHVVVQSFVSEMFIEDSDVYKLETGYNYRIIWPILDCVSKLMDTTRLQSGEIRLCAICDELKLVDKDDSSYYNADGLILNSKHSLEIGILETTDPFHHVNNPKETQD